MWPPGSRSPGRSRAPPRDWRSLLPELVRMVPWPRGTGGPQSEEQVLENVLGYIRYLRSSVSSARGGAGPPIGDPVDVGPSAGVTPSPPHQKLVPYEEEEEEEEEEGPRGGPSPPLCPPQPYWEELGREEGVSLCPPPRQGALLASPPPPAPPGDVIRDLFPEAFIGAQEAEAGGSPVPPPRGRGQGGAAPPPKEEMRERVHHVLSPQQETLPQRSPGPRVHCGHAGAGAALAEPQPR
ncbi:basic salivary proline-rich protein 2-like [Lathamus discolor]|uniref:basic salivary proline-rich protein 2-like n=1 Tax=Lathamus discolor TaxID=678569 RepID=UPI0032B8738F